MGTGSWKLDSVSSALAYIQSSFRKKPTSSIQKYHGVHSRYKWSYATAVRPIRVRLRAQYQDDAARRPTKTTITYLLPCIVGRPPRSKVTPPTCLSLSICVWRRKEAFALFLLLPCACGLCFSRISHRLVELGDRTLQAERPSEAIQTLFPRIIYAV